MTEKNITISIVIPAYNEAKNIAACLESLAKQNTARPFEVILVDNNSTDNTVYVAQQFAPRLQLRVVAESRQTRGAARAAGFAQAQGEIILSTDADTVVPPNWIELMASALEKNIASGAVTGLVKVEGLPLAQTKFFNWFWPKYNLFCYLFSGSYILSGFNFVVFKKNYERVGGFNPNLHGMEDADLGLRLKKIGPIVFYPDAPVTFSGRRFIKRGLVIGLLEYAYEFIRYYLSGKKRGELRDAH